MTTTTMPFLRWQLRLLPAARGFSPSPLLSSRTRTTTTPTRRIVSGCRQQQQHREEKEDGTKRRVGSPFLGDRSRRYCSSFSTTTRGGTAMSATTQPPDDSTTTTTATDEDTTIVAAADNNDTDDETSAAAAAPVYDNVILYDGVCNFCNAWVDVLLRLDVRKQFVFAPLQSDVGKRLLVSIGKQEDDISSVLLIKRRQQKQREGNDGDEDGDSDGNEHFRFYDKSDCVLQVVRELPGPAGRIFSAVVSRLVPLPLRNRVYDTVAQNRYNLLGKRDECRCSDPKYSDRFVS